MSEPSTLGVFLRGLAMGSADIVPGVSGGTVALITGIYDRLVRAIAAAHPRLLAPLFRGEWKTLWQALDGAFLLPLLAGIFTAVLILARGIQWLLANYPLPLWSFFFGLVFASAIFLLREEVPKSRSIEVGMVVVGVIVAAAIGLAPAMTFLPGPLGYFLAGALAICAMILPGISGSFILLLLGMYAPVIAAITSFDWLTLLIFGVGCIAGLLGFSNALNWILDRARRLTMALLSGFLFGSLVILWPWQSVISSVIDRHGEMRVVQTVPMLPQDYALTVGDNQLLACVLASVFGGLLVLWAHRASSSSESQVESS